MIIDKHRFGLLFWINAVAFGLYALFAFSSLREGVSGGLLHSFTTLFVVFLVTGQNTVALIEASIGKYFSLIEKIALIPLVALLLPPLTVTLCSSAVGGNWLPFVPIYLAGITTLAAIWVRPFFWEEHEDIVLSPHLAPAGLLAFVCFSFLVFHLTTAFYALPDFDPYYWLQKFQTEYPQNIATGIQLHRPLFSSLGYIFFQTAGVDLYAYFKYTLPWLALLVILPAALVANHMRRLPDAILVFLLPAVSGSFLLYTFSSLPQSILNTLFLSGIYLAIHGILRQQSIFFFVTGGVFFLATLYHEMAALFFLPWILVFLIAYRRALTTLIRHHWLTTLLISLLIVSYLSPALFEMGRFLFSWTNKIIQTVLLLQPNLAFPATYINVDGNPVGWGNWSGVLRYYAFYFGPLAGGALIILGWQLIAKRKSFSLTTLNPSLRIGLAFLTLLLLFFFGISELLPRFFNIALLPERAMSFLGFLVLAFIPITLFYRRPWPKIFTLLLIAAALINASAALYINGEKRFLITPNQISSAEWIRGTLPTDRIIFTGSHWNLIRFHSQTETAIKVEDPHFYQDIRVFDTLKRNLPSENQLYRRSFGTLLVNLDNSLKRLHGLDPVAQRDEAYSELVSNNTKLQNFLVSKYPDDTTGGGVKKTDIYIYYAKPNTESPYANRPYMKAQEIIRPGDVPVFDHYPNRFQRVYALPDDEVVIWKLVQ